MFLRCGRRARVPSRCRPIWTSRSTTWIARSSAPSNWARRSSRINRSPTGSGSCATLTAIFSASTSPATDNAVMVEIALVGAGRIGLPVARQLVAAGPSIRVHDVRAEVEHQATELGATWGEPLQETDVLVTVPPGSPELRALMLDGSGLLNRLSPGTTWLDLTSASPALGAELAAAAAHHQIDYLETPVGGGPDAAAAGELTLYVAGDSTTFERLQPILRAFAKDLHYTGPHGSGYLTKLLVNL